MNTENLTRIIRDIRYAGEHPLLQYDILDAETLRRVLPVEYISLNAWRLGKVLRAMGMHPVGLTSVKGRRCHLWTCHPPRPLSEIVAIARYRVQENLTELKTEIALESGGVIPPAPPKTLLTPEEREVLTLRLQHHPPRRIATMLRTFTFRIHAISARIKQKLKIHRLNDLEELRAAVQKSGVLMDDPAFR